MGKYAGNNAHLTDAIAKDLDGVASFNDLKVVSDLLARYNLSIKELVQVVRQIYKKDSPEFQSFQRLTERRASTLVPHLDVDLQGKAVAHSEHKAKSNERAARAAAMELAGPDFKIGKPGALHYQRKKRYFPNISANNPPAGFGGDVTD